MNAWWPLEYQPIPGGDPTDGEWTCAPWRDTQVQLPGDSLIPRIVLDATTGNARVFIDAIDFDGHPSAWQVDLTRPTAVELCRTHQPPDVPPDQLVEIFSAELLSGRQYVQTEDTTLDARTSTGRVGRLEALPDDLSMGGEPVHVHGPTFLSGSWADDAVSLSGARILTLDYRPADQVLAVDLSLAAGIDADEALRWRFTFREVSRFSFRCDPALMADDPEVAHTFFDEDYYLLAGSACSLFVQSPAVTAAPLTNA